ncbi:unnamed protein product [Rangifer tarandus platyrhynchus]|uniref:Uncharacterized protein n=1 Tax=Rangifer tarandus platyrhynchus TaxID=3082113 RepID=A0ABN8Z3M8_RANTA|nr:unnamed protein product [Rangifer tarandus platyrhynchus]
MFLKVWADLGLTGDPLRGHSVPQPGKNNDGALGISDLRLNTALEARRVFNPDRDEWNLSRRPGAAASLSRDASPEQGHEIEMRNENVSVAHVRKAELLGHPSPGRRLDTRLRAAPGGANPHPRGGTPVPPQARSTPRRRSPVGNQRRLRAEQTCEGRLPRSLAPVGRHLERTLGGWGGGVGPPCRLPAGGAAGPRPSALLG